MATWTTIADARLEPDKPARSIDALALRDNPIAIAENAANAPKVNQYYLLITTSTTWTVPKTGQYWIDLIGGGGGGSGVYSGGSGGGGGGSGYVASKTLTLTQGDTYPIVIGIAGNGGGSGASGVGGAATTGFGLSTPGGNGGASSGAGGTGHSNGRNGTPASGGDGGSAPLLIPVLNATGGGGGSGGSGGFGYGAGGGGGAAGYAGGKGAQGAVIIRGI